MKLLFGVLIGVMLVFLVMCKITAKSLNISEKALTRLMLIDLLPYPINFKVRAKLKGDDYIDCENALKRVDNMCDKIKNSKDES